MAQLACMISMYTWEYYYSPKNSAGLMGEHRHIQNMKLICSLGGVGHQCAKSQDLLREHFEEYRDKKWWWPTNFQVLRSVCIVYTLFHAVNPICEAGDFLLLIATLYNMLYAYNMLTSKLNFFQKAREHFCMCYTLSAYISTLGNQFKWI